MQRLSVISFFLIVLLFSTLSFAQESKELKFMVSKFEVQFYGYVKLDLVYDDSQTYFGKINFFANPHNGSKDNQFNFTVNQTRLGFSVKAPDVFGFTPRAVVEMDFYGGGNDNTPNPRLYRAFAQFKGSNFEILGGQDWDTHSTLHPTMLNFGYLATAGNIMYRRPQLRFKKTVKFSDSIRMITAHAIAHTTSPDLDGNGENDGEDSGIPTYQGRIAYEHQLFQNLPLTLAFSGHFGREEIDWDYPGQDQNYNTWSLNGELILPIFDFAYIQGEYFCGSNLDAYFGGISQGINQTTRTAINARGGWGEITLLPFNKFKFHLGAGVDRARKSDVNDGDKYQNISIFSNVYYSIVQNLIVGFEYSHFNTHYKNSNNGKDNRYHLALIYGF